MATQCELCKVKFKKYGKKFIRYRGSLHCPDCFSTALKDNVYLSEKDLEYQIALRKHYGLSADGAADGH